MIARAWSEGFRGHVRARAITFATAIVIGFTLCACTTAPSSDTSGLPRLDVVAGQELVIPMDETWPASAGGSLVVRLDDGSSVKAGVHRIVVRVDTDPLLERVARWLPPPGVWSSLDQPTISPEQSNQLSGTIRVVSLTLPRGSRARVLRVAEKDFAINTLPSIRGLLGPTRPGTVDTGDPWAPTFGSAGAVSPILTALAWPEAQSPIGRWRFRLMAGTLRPELDPPPFDIFADPATRSTDTGGFQAFEDPVVEALARQNESRWRVAIATLWATDADLASRVKRRLAAVVDFGSGYVAPAWPTDHAAIDALLADILDPALTATQRALRAESWLSLQPTAIAWVVDDSGTLDAMNGMGVGSACVANLNDVATLAWTSSHEGETKDLRPLPAYSVRRLLLEPTAPKDDRATSESQIRPPAPRARGPSIIAVHAGRWQERLAVFDERISALPPNLRVGPLLPDYTMTSWLGAGSGSGAGVPRQSSPEWMSAAMLHKVGDGWELFVECKSPRPANAPHADFVRIWLGPLGQPTSVLRVDARGTVADEARRPDLVPTPPDARVVTSSDTWSFRIRIPSACIEKDGVLRLGLTRTNTAPGGGLRSAWPRPMLPWQEEPGRLAIDTAKWSS